jgi:hypothetical protein
MRMTAYAPLDQRLYGAAQQLILAHLSGTETERPESRNLVQGQDAADALLLALIAIQEQVQTAQMRREAAFRMVALLMVVREYIQPIPGGIAEDGTDLLAADLAQLVEVVRLTRRG